MSRHHMTGNMANVLKTVCVLVAVFCGLASGGLLTGPLHASCNVDWKFPSITCVDVEHRLVRQIQQWTSADNCKNGGERCLYTLKSESSEEIKAVHETPKKHYKDDLTFILKTCGSGCCVHGYSTSETWYAILDSSTNYCNLRNLVYGADLNKDPGFEEKTSNSVCTQYSSADCDKY